MSACDNQMKCSFICTRTGIFHSLHALSNDLVQFILETNQKAMREIVYAIEANTDRKAKVSMIFEYPWFHVIAILLPKTAT